MKLFIEKIGQFTGRKHILSAVVLSLIINVAIETISRKSIISLFGYISDDPFVFVYNSLIILLTLLPALFIRRRTFYYAFISFVWLGFSIANSTILIFRTTPLTASDLLLIKSAIDVLNKYFSPEQIWMLGILLVVLIIFAISLCVMLFIKAHKIESRIPYVKYICVYLGVIIVFYTATKLGVSTGRIAVNFGNIAEAYKTYGFPYCFSNSLVNTGIDRPEDYSEELVLEILYKIEEELEDDKNPVMGNDDVNIIFLQLESFFDVKYLKNITVSENPLPVFQSLKDTYSSGFVRVPSIGAGTANTEFEMITGMNLDFFGPGEYPYKTVLQDNTCESFPFILKNRGYKTHAIHNNTASFYDRDIVFRNLGFDTFTSLEYMNVEEFTPNGWAKDFYLTDAIIDCLISTKDTADYIYTISVQAHGKYPDEIDLAEGDIIAYNEDNTINPEYTYYVNQLKEVDKFIGELTASLNTFSEKTVVVMYGDHLPSLGIENETLKNGDIFQTEYVIWSNFSMDNTNKNLEAYQLGAYVLERLGINSGIISAYHQFFSNSDDYLDKLQVIQYDMLYGGDNIYEGASPYQPTDMKMGVRDIYIDDVIVKEDGSIYIRGRNFTSYSIIMLNDTDVETEYIDSETLRTVADIELLDELETVTVGQGKLGLDKISISNVYDVNSIRMEDIDE